MASTSQRSIGERIVAARGRKGLTQVQLCALSALTQPQLSRYETGARTPSVSHLSAIARALGCTVDDLVPRGGRGGGGGGDSEAHSRKVPQRAV